MGNVAILYLSEDRNKKEGNKYQSPTQEEMSENNWYLRRGKYSSNSDNNSDE